MENEVIIQEAKTLTAKEVKAQVNLIQEVMESVMKKDVHYGIVPGCGLKPTLLKSGAEKILTTFRLAVNPTIEDLSNPDEIRYRIMANIMSVSGAFIGAGVGECSTKEEKFNWRKAICDGEYNTTPEDRRREKWLKDGTTIKQIRTNPADLANTILKMAKKRALVDGTLTATAASDIFSQDLEDLPDDLINQNPIATKPRVETPKEKSAPVETATENVTEVIPDAGINVIEALAQPVGAIFDCWGILFQFSSRKVNTTNGESDISDYELSPRSETQIIKVSVFGLPPIGLVNGSVVALKGVKSKLYKDKITYLAKNIEILEKGIA